MSDLQILFLVLAALYAWECACWLRRGSVAFTTWLGRTWRAAHPGVLLGNPRGGFVFAAPLPPLGTLLTANQFPLSLSPEVALAFVASNVNPGWRPAQSGRFVRWDDFREACARGKKLLVNGEVWWTAPSAGLARRHAGELSRLARLKPEARGPAIRELLEASLDAQAVEQRWQEFRRETRAVRWLSNALVVYLFVLAPAVIWSLGLKLSWLGLVAGVLALTLTIATVFQRAHHALFPDAEDERFTLMLTIALSPANAMRAHDALSRPLLEQFHPLAVAQVLLAPADFQNLARRVLLDLRNPARPAGPSNEAAVREAELFSRQVLCAAVEDLLRRSDVPPDSLCRPPKPAETACRAYCPRCHAQFTTVAGECADCGGLALVAFGSGDRRSPTVSPGRA